VKRGKITVYLYIKLRASGSLSRLVNLDPVSLIGLVKKKLY